MKTTLVGGDFVTLYRELQSFDWQHKLHHSLVQMHHNLRESMGETVNNLLTKEGKASFHLSSFALVYLTNILLDRREALHITLNETTSNTSTYIDDISNEIIAISKTIANLEKLMEIAKISKENFDSYSNIIILNKNK